MTVTKSVSIRISEQDLRLIDQAVAEGRYSTRTDLLRTLLESFVEQDSRRRLAEEFQAAYSGPQTPDEAELREFGRAAAERGLARETYEEPQGPARARGGVGD